MKIVVAGLFLEVYIDIPKIIKEFWDESYPFILALVVFSIIVIVLMNTDLKVKKSYNTKIKRTKSECAQPLKEEKIRTFPVRNIAFWIGGIALLVIIIILFAKFPLPSFKSTEKVVINKEETVLERIWNEMVFVEGGKFTMGCTAEQGSDCDKNEMPSKQITVSRFYIGKYEVTQAQWKEVMGENPSHFKGDSLPVENVSWIDIKEFIDKLNARTGKNYRLPTEAEWEFAARGGKKSKNYKYSGSNSFENVAWHNGNSSNIRPVGQKEPNELDIYDMSGNVWEWCNDWYGIYSNDVLTDPDGPSLGESRVIRGGSLSFPPEYCRVTFRTWGAPIRGNAQLGFRLAHTYSE